MAQEQKVTCDAPGCGKDITEGEGRMWRYSLNRHTIRMRPDTKSVAGAGDIHPEVHLCDEKCLKTYADSLSSA